jgi:hypothetical protein
MIVTLYLLIGLAVAGALYWALTQITARQRRLNAELTRLEQLAAEVSLNAGAILERIDQRTAELTALLAQVEARVEAHAEATLEPAPAPAPAPAPRKRSRTKEPERQALQPAPSPAPTPPASEVPAPVQRYQELRTAAWALADQGKESGAIAEALGIPRGEVELLLNLRGKKVSA